MNYTTEIVASTADEGLHFPIMEIQGQMKRESRNGPTLEFPGLSTIVWTHPERRVMFDSVRDANPFFALFESIWMLGGRQDLASIVYFNSQFGQYSDDGKFIRGSAYGVRWRSWFGHDQLEAAKRRVEKEGINTRRLVIMQWDAATDPVVDSLDVPCNAMCCLLLRDGKLDLTVFNRSNDAIFGAAGSNIVHFSMFLEYMAEYLGVPMGKYFQVSNCFHAYTDFPIYKKIAPGILDGSNNLRKDYENGLVQPSFMFSNCTSEEFVWDCNEILDRHAFGLAQEECPVGLPDLTDDRYRTPFFRAVFLPMMRAWKHWKEKKDARGAARLLQAIIDKAALRGELPYDWHVAGLEWMQRRIK